MKELSTSILIKAPAKKVWSVLTDFSEYPEWNPFIISVEGQVSIGNKIKITLAPPDSGKMVFKPKVLNYEENKELLWLGHLIFPGLFDGRHIFRIKDNGDNTVTFIQKEIFKGILVPLFSKMLDTKTRKGFILMNEKLKAICESN